MYSCNIYITRNIYICNNIYYYNLVIIYIYIYILHFCSETLLAFSFPVAMQHNFVLDFHNIP